MTRLPGGGGEKYEERAPTPVGNGFSFEHSLHVTCSNGGCGGQSDVFFVEPEFRPHERPTETFTSLPSHQPRQIDSRRLTNSRVVQYRSSLRQSCQQAKGINGHDSC